MNLFLYKHLSRLGRLVRDKHFSLFWLLITDREKSFNNIDFRTLLFVNPFTSLVMKRILLINTIKLFIFAAGMKYKPFYDRKIFHTMVS